MRVSSYFRCRFPALPIAPRLVRQTAEYRRATIGQRILADLSSGLGTGEQSGQASGECPTGDSAKTAWCVLRFVLGLSAEVLIYHLLEIEHGCFSPSIVFVLQYELRATMQPRVAASRVLWKNSLARLLRVAPTLPQSLP
jgi:hypothetical protein